MGKNSEDTTPEVPEPAEAPATAETPVAATEAATPPPPAASASSSGTSKGVVAAIAGGSAVVALLLGLLIGWFAFDHDGGHGGRGDKDRMEQKQQGPGNGIQRGGGQKGGMMPDDEMMPGAESGEGGRGQTMPGPGRGQMRPDNAIPIEPTAPTTQGSVVPQSLQQG